MQEACYDIAAGVGDILKVGNLHRTIQICTFVNLNTFNYDTQHSIDARWIQTDFKVCIGHESLGILIMIKESYMNTQLDKAMLSLMLKTLKNKSLAIASFPPC